MSRTAVQLRSDPNFNAKLLHGKPLHRIGQVVVFGPGQLVVYMIEGFRHTITYVFKTLPHATANAAKLPGVTPRVSLLLEARGSLSVSRIRNLLRYLERRKASPDDLSEAFWIRLDAVLSGQIRRAPVSTLKALMRHEQAA